MMILTWLIITVWKNVLIQIVMMKKNVLNRKNVKRKIVLNKIVRIKKRMIKDLKIIKIHFMYISIRNNYFRNLIVEEDNISAI